MGDAWAEANLQLHESSALIYLKQKLLAATSKQAAELVIREISMVFKDSESEDQVRNVLNPVFIDPQTYCSYGGQKQIGHLGQGLQSGSQSVVYRPARKGSGSSNQSSGVEVCL